MMSDYIYMVAQIYLRVPFLNNYNYKINNFNGKSRSPVVSLIKMELSIVLLCLLVAYLKQT